MANAQQQENMLLTEHFSWPPISLIDDVINAINEVLYRCTDTFATGIASAPPHLLGFADRYAAEKRTPATDDDGRPAYPDAALEMDEGVLKLETLMENAVDKNFDKLEIWTLRNVLCLPRGEEELARWVRLGHYDGVAALPSDVERTWTPEKLYALRRKLVETQRLHAALAAEQRRNAATIAQLQSLLRPAPALKTEPAGPSLQHGDGAFAFLAHADAAKQLGISLDPPNGANADPAPLTTHAAFTASQLPYLRQLLANLTPHLSSAALPANSASATSDSRERKVYLESQSKRILERRGVDTIAGVEGAVEGARVRAEEVRGLEGVVEGLGRRATAEKEGTVPGEAMDVS